MALRRLRPRLRPCRRVTERPAIAVVVMHFDHLADHAFVDQPLGGDMRRIPGQRPVDREACTVALQPRRSSGRPRRATPRTAFRPECAAPKRRHLLDHSAACSAVAGHRIARSGLRAAMQASRVGEHPSAGMPNAVDRAAHARAVFVADADDLRIGMLMHLAQQVAHVHVVEIDADNAPSLARHVVLHPRQTRDQIDVIRRLPRGAHLMEFAIWRKGCLPGKYHPN